MKKCSKCGSKKDESCFGKDKHMTTGLKCACKECMTIEKKQQWARMSDEEKQHRYKRLREWRNALNEERREKLNSKMRVENMSDETRDRRKAQARKSRSRRPKEILMSYAKHRSKLKNIEFSITKDDIEIPEVCPVLGIPLIKGDGKLSDNSPTIDRIDNSKGYVKGNVMVISHRANLIKNSASIREVELILEYMRTYQPKYAEADRIV